MRLEIMIEPKSERRNPFYILLIVAGFAFVVTALAYAVVPVLEQKARDAGNPPPQSPFRDSLREDGWIWLLYQGVLIAILAVLSMGLDRWRRWRTPAESSPPLRGGSNSEPPRSGGLP
jgi:hypothetical protein